MFGIFLASQVLDGLLTFVGIRRYGEGVEANVLIHTIVAAWGPTHALASAKALACVCGTILYLTQSHRLLAAAAGGSIGVAVVPWLLILLTK